MIPHTWEKGKEVSWSTPKLATTTITSLVRISVRERMERKGEIVGTENVFSQLFNCEFPEPASLLPSSLCLSVCIWVIHMHNTHNSLSQYSSSSRKDDQTCGWNKAWNVFRESIRRVGGERKKFRLKLQQTLAGYSFSLSLSIHWFLCTLCVKVGFFSQGVEKRDSCKNWEFPVRRKREWGCGKKKWDFSSLCDPFAILSESLSSSKPNWCSSSSSPQNSIQTEG